jgi:DNA ligase 1
MAARVLPVLLIELVELVALVALVVLGGFAQATESALPGAMLATSYESGIEISEYLVSEKLDGVRGRWDGDALWFRSGERIHAPAWFTADWPTMPMDGELWIGRGRFDEVSGIVRARTPDDAEWREVRFMVFDLPAHPGPFEDRAAAILAHLQEMDIPWLRPVAQFRVQTIEELEATLDRLTTAGGEGLMLHHGRARYRPGPSRHLLKYKRHQEAEAIVVGHAEGQGKYQGMLGALVVERSDGLRFRLGSGFTDHERASPPPLGSRVTYRFNGLTANGTPRFARFVRVREPALPAVGHPPGGTGFNR